MTDATVTTILDRMYAIHQLAGGGVSASRYWPQNIADSWRFPFLTGTQRGGAHEGVTDEGWIRITRTFSIVGVAGTFEQGIPTETAQTNVETLTEVIENLYFSRDRLQLATNSDELVYLISAKLGTDTGLAQREPSLAVIEFPLIVEYQRIVTLL